MFEGTESCSVMKSQSPGGVNSFRAISQSRVFIKKGRQEMTKYPSSRPEIRYKPNQTKPNRAGLGWVKTGK